MRIITLSEEQFVLTLGDLKSPENDHVERTTIKQVSFLFLVTGLNKLVRYRIFL